MFVPMRQPGARVVPSRPASELPPPSSAHSGPRAGATVPSSGSGSGTSPAPASKIAASRHGCREAQATPNSAEAESPLSAAAQMTQPTAWCRADVTMRVVETSTGTVSYEQEIVEVLAVHGDELLAGAALVARAPGLPPCLGGFQLIG